MCDPKSLVQKMSLLLAGAVCITICVVSWFNTCSVYDYRQSEHHLIPSRVHHQADMRSTIGSPYHREYAVIGCINERSTETCSFPLLNDYHRRCGYFAGSTSWENKSDGYPNATLTAQLCRLPAQLAAAAQNGLLDYIRQQHITSIVLFGDSQGKRYHDALADLFKAAAFKCVTIKVEPVSKMVNLDYYTKESGIHFDEMINRTCSSCTSSFLVCTNNTGHKVRVEYISLVMTAKIAVHVSHPECKQSNPHPLCMNISQQEFVMKYYLNREQYPQLLMIFSTFVHDRMRRLNDAYDGIRYMYELITTHVPASSAVIFYNSPPWHANKMVRWFTAEGKGFDASDKIREENRFLSDLFLEHLRSGTKPLVHSFMDLYHMQEQLRQVWASDQVHSKPHWYKYVIGATAAMLPSIPVT